MELQQKKKDFPILFDNLPKEFRTERDSVIKSGATIVSKIAIGERKDEIHSISTFSRIQICIW